jgi:2-oxo-4-hydroxy-4-carboxy--5-ureidoimidazoline (OHCU) decarboxylase
MKLFPLAIGLAVLAPSLAWGHSGGLDQYGCHNDNTKGDYHCHQGQLKDRTYKSQDTMLRAHPDMRDGAEKAAARAENSERAKKAKAEDKLKDGDKTRTEEYAKDAKKKSSAKDR